ncbi:MAG TPA: hypothetical protein VH025_04045 [Solirubrobacteraceae bacterium]|nr:hypothetical protein [Solirubrobacteraceae bacterium]
MLLSELTSDVPRLALVGLAKNTGKTVALNALLAELADAGRRVAVTSVGRDGEEHDVIDFRIEKPAVALLAGSIVASTDSLLRASGVALRPLASTGVRTPLGEVQIAELIEDGTIEIAGPSGAADVRAVADEMLGHGAEQVLIDGAIDRRAASSPDVADGLVMSTGAILSEDIDELVQRTVDAVALVRLPTFAAGEQERSLLRAGTDAFIAGEDGLPPIALPPRFVLTADEEALSGLLSEHAEARRLLIGGALPERFVRDAAAVARRRGRDLTLVVADPTKIFLHEHGLEFYGRQGVAIEALTPIDLRALTVNPVAPQSHSFDSARLRSQLAAAIPGTSIYDVMGAEYRGEQGLRPRMRATRS